MERPLAFPSFADVAELLNMWAQAEAGTLEEYEILQSASKMLSQWSGEESPSRRLQRHLSAAERQLESMRRRVDRG